jgi:uncharacterized membrane protein
VKEPTQPADPLSILSLAGGIGALILALFSMTPVVGPFCLAPVSALCALLALVTGIASVVRTTMNPQLDGRQQAIVGIVFSLVWCLVAAIFAVAVMRNQ